MQMAPELRIGKPAGDLVKYYKRDLLVLSYLSTFYYGGKAKPKQNGSFVSGWPFNAEQKC